MVCKTDSKLANTPKTAFDAYMADLDVIRRKTFPQGFSSQDRRNLIGLVKAGTVRIKLPSNYDIIVESARQSVEIWPVFPKLVGAIFGYSPMLKSKRVLASGFPVFDVNSSECYSIEELMDGRGPLNRKDPRASAKCTIQSSNGYLINSYYGRHKISLSFRTKKAAEARDMFVLGNLPLVVWAAKKFRDFRGEDLLLSKLVEVGNDFLLRNCHYFNPDDGEFSNFFKKIVFKEFGLHLRAYLTGEVVSYEDPFSLGYEEAVAEESIGNQRYKDPLTALISGERNDAVELAVRKLSPRERKVVRLRFWQDEKYGLIGGQINKTGERARQIKKDAVNSLGENLELAKIA